MTEKYKVSDCCQAAVTQLHECEECGQPCESIEQVEEYYDEVRADDERGQKQEAA